MGVFLIVERVATGFGAHAAWPAAMPKVWARLKGIPVLTAVPIAVSGTSCRAFAAKGAMNAQRQGKIYEIGTIWKGMIRLRAWRIPFVSVGFVLD